ncbi:MAG: hypothetical protein JST68_14620 [Bacteroidetes bacterium]|nr:hypothetical protein [Bacteroidota bacterium]
MLSLVKTAKRPSLCGLVIFLLSASSAYSQGPNTNAQSPETTTDKVVGFPSRLLNKLQAKAAKADQEITRQTEKYIEKARHREEKLRQKLMKVDSNAAKQLFANSAQKYAELEQKLKTDSGTRNLTGSYLPYLDSLQGTLSFLKKGTASGAGLNEATMLQSRLADADQAKAYVQQRKQEIGQYISQHTNLQTLLGKQYAGFNQDLYYYSQQLREYKEMWSNPDKLEQKALQLLNQLPAFQEFMKNNSQLAGLFRLPGSYGTPAALTGLQTRDQVNQLIQNQVAAGGPGATAALQSNLESAKGQLDGYKDKLDKLGQGNGDIDMPNFKPNDQKTKTFWNRLEYGANFQTARNNYFFPTTTDFGGSIGYKLGHGNVIGVGGSYKVGWGNGIQHISVTSQGVGMRSFLEVKIKSSFSATGGFEYNFATPFDSFQDLKQIERWTKSGLIGISKTVSMKGRYFKKTKLQLLWDFLSYQQVPRTQTILFRVGYVF